MRRLNSSPSLSIAGSIFLAIILAMLAGIPFAAAVDSASAGYVYVASETSGTYNNIAGFAVAQDGSAQPVPGSPYQQPGLSLVSHAGYLFGSDGANIITYARGNDGSLHKLSSINGAQHCVWSGCATLGLQMDNTGKDMYTFQYYYDGANNAILGWKVSPNGDLTYSSGASASPVYATVSGWPLSFTGDDRYAYTWAVCKWSSGPFGTARQNNGMLEYLTPGAEPPPPTYADGYVGCTDYAIASPAGFAAIEWTGSYCCDSNAVLLASYTINTDGTLGLVAGSGQVPGIKAGSGLCGSYCSPASFDPSGKYLLVVGSGASSGATQVYELQPDGKLQPAGDPQPWPLSPAFGYAGWDSAGHVYAVGTYCSRQNNYCGSELYIFNFNAGRLTLAPGSPYAVSGTAAGLAVMTAQTVR